MRKCSVLLLAVLIALVNCKADQNNEVALKLLPKEVYLKEKVDPGVDKTKCGGLWNKHGFVCDKSQLIFWQSRTNRK